jgi:hypothetical protein
MRAIDPGCAAQLGYLLEGIDWRLPQHSWRPAAAGLSGAQALIEHLQLVIAKMKREMLVPPTRLPGPLPAPGTRSLADAWCAFRSAITAHRTRPPRALNRLTRRMEGVGWLYRLDLTDWSLDIYALFDATDYWQK